MERNRLPCGNNSFNSCNGHEHHKHRLYRSLGHYKASLESQKDKYLLQGSQIRGYFNPVSEIRSILQDNGFKLMGTPASLRNYLDCNRYRLNVIWGLRRTLYTEDFWGIQPLLN